MLFFILWPIYESYEDIYAQLSEDSSSLRMNNNISRHTIYDKSLAFIYVPYLILMMVEWELFYNINNIITFPGYYMWIFHILVVTFWISLLKSVIL